jgi:hypothetical protein
MLLNGPQNTEGRIRRLELESGGSDATDAQVLQRQIDELNHRLTASNTPSTPTNQGINQMLRNTDHPHSVNTWWEAAPSADNKEKECANVYAYPPINPIVIDDAEMDPGGGSPTHLYSPANKPFAGMEGRWVHVTGAGVAGATLVAQIITVVGPDEVILSIAATTFVLGVTAVINLQKLGHTNSLNAGGTDPSDALKDAAHTNYGTNIQDPDWDKTRGIVRLGSTNVAGYPFGRFDNTGLIYVALHQLQSGREPFFRVNVARANQYVKIRGKLFIGIYNNNTEVLDWVHGSNLTLSPTLDPNPPASVISTDYMVVLETGQGITIVSDVLTVANAPTDAAFGGGATLNLAWLYYAGVISATVYRRRTGQNVFKMEVFSTGANTWTDTNISTRIDTGSVSFPVFDSQISAIPSYWASADNEFEDLTYDGQPDRFWQPVTGRLPFSPSVNMGTVFDPHFIIGLTEGPSTYLTDAETHSNNVVDSIAAQFTADMTGKSFVLTKSDGSLSVSGTVTFVSPSQITISVPTSWSEAGGLLEIFDSQPHGLLYDLVGCSMNEGEWDFHPEDNSEFRGQPVASNPNGSTQGGTGGQDPTDTGGRGGIDCVLDEAMVTVQGTERTGWICVIIDVIRYILGMSCISGYRLVQKRAIDVLHTDRVWSGHGRHADSFNDIDWINVKYVDNITWLLTDTKELPCTSFHRITDGPASFRWGIAVGNLSRGRKVLISDEYSSRVETVLSLRAQAGRFRVVSFGLKQSTKPTASLLVINGIVSHNMKIEPVLVA